MYAYIIVFLTFFISINSFSQSINYKKQRNCLLLTSCDITDLKNIETSLDNLSSLDTLKMKKYLFYYYQDFGNLYYQKYLHDKSDLTLEKSAEYFNRALLLKRKDSYTLWQYAFMLALLGRCEEFKNTIEKYIKYTSSKKIDTSEIISLNETCLNNGKKENQ